jgi:hypothetical protein
MTSDGASRNGTGRKVLKVATWLLLAGLLLSAVLVAAWAAWGEPMRHAVVAIDETQVDLAQLQGGHWLLAIAGVFVGLLVATVVVLLVVPLAVLLPLLVAGLVCAAGLLVVAAVGGLLLSPLILLVWVVWRLSRRSLPATTITP